MLAFGIRYLNGFVAAAEPDDRERAEWPPHPGRVFMALAAAHFQTGADAAERAALLAAMLDRIDRVDKEIARLTGSRRTTNACGSARRSGIAAATAAPP